MKHILAALLILLSVSAHARSKTECNIKTGQCVVIQYTAQEEAAADAEIAAANKPKIKTEAEKLIDFLALKFNMSPEQIKTELANMK